MDKVADMEKPLFSTIGKQVLGLDGTENDGVRDEERFKVVDEIESLCLECEQNVGSSFQQQPRIDVRARLDYC